MITIRTESKIDSGGFGEVFIAIVIETGKKVALKRLAKPYTEDDAKRFKREVQIMSSLDHPNIMKILLHKLDLDPPLYVMPLAEKNLEDILSELRLDETRRNLIFNGMLEAIKYAHDNNVIHRDIKPQNILLFEGDKVMVADFGIGRFVNRDITTITRLGEQIGTMEYAAPEQITDFHHADARSDIYSLGKILYKMLTDRPVYPIADISGLEGKYAFMIKKCLEVNIDMRYQTIGELIKDFKLLTQKKFNVQAPSERAQTLISNMIDPFFGVLDSECFDDFIRLFVENNDNETLYINILPKVSERIVKELNPQQLSDFIIVLQIYDNHINKGLPFVYCDTVAQFYEKIYRILDDFVIKEIIISRLLVMGHSHNRWFVRETLARIVENIEDIGETRLILETFRRFPDEVEWSRSAINVNKLHPLLREGIKEICDTDDDEFEIPF